MNSYRFQGEGEQDGGVEINGSGPLTIKEWVPRSALNRTSKRQTCLGGFGARPSFLAMSKVSRTKKSTQLFLKFKVFMPEMKLNSIWARDVLMCTNQRTTQ